MFVTTNNIHLNLTNQIQLDFNRFKRETGCADNKSGAAGGKGRFGFNSYNLLTFAILSYNIVSNIISNVNNNANNNNNNDNLLNFGSSNVAESSTSADNANKNMLMITVPPAGPPVVVPTGKLLSNGTIILNNGLEHEGVSWYLPRQGWKVFDNGTIQYNETLKEVGVTSFGYIDDKSQFKSIRDLDNNLLTWKKLRSLRSPRKKGRPNNDKLELDPIGLKNYSVKLPLNTIDTIYDELETDANSLQLVLTAISVVGPPIIVPIGFILINGDILLNEGVEVDGAYWESPERTLFENGTIIYKGLDLVDSAKIIFGSVSTDGVISSLPTINNQKVNLSLLKKLNIRNFTNKPKTMNKPANSQNTIVEDLNLALESILNRINENVLTKRSTTSLSLHQKVIKGLRLLTSFIDLSSEYDITTLDQSETVLQNLTCSLVNFKELKNLNNDSMLSSDKKLKCFIRSIDAMCTFR